MRSSSASHGRCLLHILSWWVPSVQPFTRDASVIKLQNEDAQLFVLDDVEDDPTPARTTD